MTSLRSRRFADRFSALSKRGSAGRSGRPIVSQKRRSKRPDGPAMFTQPSLEREAAHRHERRVVIPLLRRNLAVDRPTHRLQVHHRDHRLEQRGAHPPSDAGALAFVERDEDADREVQSRGEVAHRDARPRRLRVREPGDAHQPAHALCDLIDAAAICVRPVLPEARDRSVHEPRVARVQDVPADAELLLHGGTHVLDEDVGLIGECGAAASIAPSPFRSSATVRLLR